MERQSVLKIFDSFFFKMAVGGRGGVYKLRHLFLWPRCDLQWLYEWP